MDLLKKFENIQINNESMLPEEDIAFCKQEQVNAEKAMLQLQRWMLFFQCSLDAEPNPYFKVVKNTYRRSDPYTVEKKETRDFDDAYLSCHFTGAYPITHIYKLMDKIKTRFIARIYYHFESSYHLQFQRIDISDESKSKAFKLDYRVILEDIKKQNNGTLDLKQVAVIRHINAFRDCVYNRSSVIEDKNNLHLDGFARYDWDYSTSNHVINSRSEKLCKLDVALSIYEKEEAIPGYCLKKLYDKTLEYNKAYLMLHCLKIEHLKFFKNGKVTIRFKSPEYVKEFIDRTDLNSLPTK